MPRRPLLFYSGWPLGYHNLEAERKARALAAAGYEVSYVAGIGIRNPRTSNLGKVADRVRRGAATRADASDDLSDGLRTCGLLVAPPRQVARVRRLNVAWVVRQLERRIGPWPETLAWIRWPTPELVDALTRLRPAATVYEAVDAYDATPGIVGRWAAVFAHYERALVDRANVVVVPGERLAQRYRAWGADVRVVPHGVDLIDWRGWQPRAGGPVVVGFVGTLDNRLDVPVLRTIAESHPDWRLRLIGPVQDGFVPRRLTDLANISVEPPVPAEAVPELVASFDLGVMPYFDHPVYRHMTPLKNLEFLAAGIPAVARPSPALEPYRHLLYFADSPDEFVGQLERALAEQSSERADARRASAERSGWPRTLAATTAIANELTGGPDLGAARPAGGAPPTEGPA